MLQLGNTASSLAFGFMEGALVYHLGQISGAHFNGVITFAFTLRGVMKWWRMLYYWLAQFLGAIIAAAFIVMFFEEFTPDGATLPKNGFSNWEAFGFEVIFTMILVVTILNVTEKSSLVGSESANAMALVFSGLMLIGGGTSFVSMNPWRSFAPAIFSGGRPMRVVWIYIFGPLLGGLVATLFTFFFSAHAAAVVSKRAQGLGTTGEEIQYREDIEAPAVSRVEEHHHA